MLLSGRPPFIGNCGKDCEWETGGACVQCQRVLWNNILDGNYEVPDGWEEISNEAKDLISHLLVKDASKRYTAETVLNHAWLSMVS